jgi:hypothetical protein
LLGLNKNRATGVADLQGDSIKKILTENYGMSEDEASYYAKNWNTLTGILDSQAYYDKRQNFVDQYDDNAYDLMKTAIANEKAMTTGTNVTGGVVTGNYQLQAAADYRAAVEQLEKEYGITGEDLALYKQYVGELENEKNTEQMKQDTEELIEEHPVIGGIASNAASIATSPARGIAALETLKKLGYADKDAPVDTNSDLYYLMNYSNAVQEGTNKAIGDDTLPQKIGQFAYGVGTSTAEEVWDCPGKLHPK